MTTTSYPVRDQNFTSVMWSKILRRQHQGVDVSMSLSLSSTSNDATISAGRANFMGYELEITDSHVVTLPAVTSTKTYVIGVMYNPALEGLDPDGPLSIVSGVKGAITTPTSGAFWPLWEVKRQPSTTLNLSEVVNYRVARASLLYADTGVSNPDPDFAQGTQVVVRRSGLWLLEGGAWKKVADDTGERTDGVTTPSDWSSEGTVWSILNGQVNVDIRGAFKSQAGSGQTGNATNGNLSDFRMCTLPKQAWPRRTQSVQGSITSGGVSVPIFGVIQPDGAFVVTATMPGVRVGPGAVLYVSATYRAV